ncbi:MAG TPA: N-acetyl-alpha-D-glucosaminyl L-malate synthase BshA, partial [Firmicutes bacterium]|nr:N-acetyl-alpha-D-glucosaminyl L-malate synthase BshA [Bacillota bacterium]
AAVGDIEALAGYALAVLNDATRLRRMGEAARRRAEELFDSRLIVPQYERLYTELLESGAGA